MSRALFWFVSGVVALLLSGDLLASPLSPVVATAEGEVRIALSLDQSAIRIGEFGDVYQVPTSTGPVSLRAPLEARSRQSGDVNWYLQVGSFGNSDHAELRAEDVREVGYSVTVAARGRETTSVLVGPFQSRAAAMAPKSDLASRGFEGAFPIRHATGGSREAAGLFLVDVRQERWEVDGDEVDVLSPGGSMLHDGSPYRGRFRFRRTPDGRLHLINVLPLEQYLRGVVPAELGPRQFPEIEALKAQAVAARTYFLRHRGETGARGYDMCATPRCQVYSGLAAEDPLSDRAIRETEAQVLLFDGEMADTLFTSTCAGQTAAVGDVFIGREEPYLVSVPCAEDLSLPSFVGKPGPSGLWPEVRTALGVEWLARRGVEVPEVMDVAWLEGALDALGSSLARARSKPVGVSVGAVLPALMQVFGLDRAAGVLHRPGDAAVLAERAVGPPHYRAMVELLRRFDLDPVVLDRPAEAPLEIDEFLELAALLMEESGLIRSREGSFFLDGEVVRLRRRSTWFDIVGRAEPLLWVGAGEHFEGRQVVNVKLADQATVWLDGDEALGVVLERRGEAADRRSPHSSWKRRLSRSELMQSIRKRHRIGGLRDLEVVERTSTGRALRLRVETGGPELVLEGLDIRFSLGVPENLFVVSRVPAAAGREVAWLFIGRGWGHGVGMCQWGAYGLATAGWSHAEILAHYYPGTDLAVLEAIPPPVP